MRQRRVGRSGLVVSRVGLGTTGWAGRTDEHEAAALLRTFREAGGSLLETVSGPTFADSQDLLGRLVGDVPRESLVLALRSGPSSGPSDLSRRGLLAGLDASLVRLGTDHVDLWLVGPYDAATPLEETVAVLSTAVASGRCRYVGVADFSAWRAVRAHALLERAGVALVADAVELNLLAREAEGELTSAGEHLGFGFLAGSPLAAGVLAGRYQSTVPADSRLASGESGDVERHLGGRTPGIVDAVTTAAAGLGVSAGEVALSWVRDRRGVSTVVVAPRTVTQLSTLLAAEELVLPDEIVAALDDVSAPPGR